MVLSAHRSGDHPRGTRGTLGVRGDGDGETATTCTITTCHRNRTPARQRQPRPRPRAAVPLRLTVEHTIQRLSVGREDGEHSQDLNFIK